MMGGQTKTSIFNTGTPFFSDCIHHERFNCFTLISCISIAAFYVNVVQTASFLSSWYSFDISTAENKWTDVSNQSQGDATYSSSTYKNLIPADHLNQTGVFSRDRPLCRRQQIYKGEWLPITLEKPPYVSKTMHLRCQISSYDYDNPGPWPSWYWEQDDSSCQIATWDSPTFCDLLPYTTVSIMGDSLSWEQYSSLLQLIGMRVHQNDQHASRLEDRNVVYFACKGKNRGTKFVFRNDAQLNAGTILNSISNDFPTVLILNRGAHYVNDTELLDDMIELLPVLLNWQQSCTKTYQRCHLFWRTTVPGHPMCEDYSAPVNNITIMESLVESRLSYTNETIWNYHWQDFKHQNKLVLDTFQAYSAITGLQYDVIDAYEINILRPDRHRWHQNDCLHSCYPGKMDVYNQLLLHFLSMSRSTDDVRYMIDRFERLRSNRTASEQNTSDSI
jgi:GDSL/SGNH-like Acyl-Esterase family found in Pmr5 and Cas1p